MKNVELKVVRDVLTIKIKLDQDQGFSTSGKTKIIATTSGNVPVEDTGAILGLNLYKYATPK